MVLYFIYQSFLNDPPIGYEEQEEEKFEEPPPVELNRSNTEGRELKEVMLYSKVSEKVNRYFSAIQGSLTDLSCA